jgi:hypothetical protein
MFDPTAQPLYDTDVFDEMPPSPFEDVAAHTMIDVQKRILAIRRAEAKLERIAAQKAEFMAFFKEKSERLDATIDELKGQIRAYMSVEGVSNVATPHGTAYLKRVEEVEWDEQQLWVWLKEEPEGIPELTRTKVELDKNAIKAYAKIHGSVPGLSFTPKEKLYVRQ